MLRSSVSVLLALLLATLLAIAAWLGVRALGQANRADAAMRVAAETVRRIERDNFARAQDTVDGLAQHPSILKHAAEGGAANATVDAVLLQARLTVSAAIVMILDRQGKVISCSSTGVSLVGNNYAFRPYFSEAMSGRRVVYGAIGVTTHRRGFYFSAPIGPAAAPFGIAVTKVELDAIDHTLQALASPAMLVSPDHVVFSTNRREWLFHSAQPLDAEQRRRLTQTRQFADRPIAALPFDTRREIVEHGHDRFSPVEFPLAIASGFRIVLLDRVRDFPLTPPQRRFVVGTGLSGVLLVGLVVALLLANARRTRAESRLRRTELHLEVALDSLADAVITTDPRGQVARMNPAAVTLMRCPNSSAIGRPLTDVLADLNLVVPPPVSCDDDSNLSPLVESQIRYPDGEERHIVQRITKMRGVNSDSMGSVFVARDVTEENRLREQLQQAQKMEAIGRLAGGVAHDFNNLLTIILGNAELVALKLKQHPMQKFAREIVGAATRAGELTRQLLAFSRKASIKSTPVDLHAILDEAISLFRRGLDPGVRLTLDFRATSTVVLGDATQLQGTFLNLLINAKDAMPAGGEIIVSTRDIQGEPNPDARHRKGIEILIEDEGEGIPEALRSRIFEPFFTTKSEGRGTGLGLAAVYGCVQSHHGRIHVESRQGSGTGFRIFLPTIEGRVSVDSDQPLRLSSPGGHYLVVDADPSLRSLTERSLVALGHDVTVVDSIDAAVTMLVQRTIPVVAVVMDAGMDTALIVQSLMKIRSVRDRVPILMTSTMHREAAELGFEGVGVRVLPKPFRVQELGAALEALLGDAAVAAKSQTTPKD